MIQSADEQDLDLCRGDFKVYIKIADAFKHVGLLDTPHDLGFDLRQTVHVWTDENVRARKYFGRNLGQLIDPDHEDSAQPPLRDGEVPVDELLVHFSTARIDGVVHIIGITNPASGWTTSIDLRFSHHTARLFHHAISTLLLPRTVC